MANEEHLFLLKQGVETWNQWRKDNPGVQPDLNGVDLSRATLGEANLGKSALQEVKLGRAKLIRADLNRANLYRANLFRANLYRANLFRADLSGADLFGADISGANLVEANLGGAILSRVKLIIANLSGANLIGAGLIETNLERANLTGCHVYGVSAWNVNLTGTIQKDLIITQYDEPVVMVDDLEVAQFVYLLLHHDKLRNILNAVTEKGVLILGRFGGGGLDVLRGIAARLRELGYIPIIFDFERPRDLNYTETVKTLVGMSRFVIVDLSGSSVPQELYATVPHYNLPFVPILEVGRKDYALFVDLLENQNVLKPIVKFENLDDLLEKLPERIVSPAEDYVSRRQRLLSELFNRPDT